MHSLEQLAMLSRWKQTSAALMHSTYVTNAFSIIDSRTMNVERALEDLDTLLKVYANSHSDSRLSHLREVLRKGAKLAFTLFGQPSFWRFDWTGEWDIDDIGREKVLGAATSMAEGRKTSIGSTPNAVAFSEIVAWPALLRVTDSEGNKIQGGLRVLAKNIYLSEFF